MEDHVLPAIAEYLRIAEGGEFPLSVIDDLKAGARSASLEPVPPWTRPSVGSIDRRQRAEG
jgi:hypothetical protein